MVSIREAVLLPGVLKGENLQAPCSVRAVKVSLIKLDTWEYVAADIEYAPGDLPDGDYIVSFEGRTMKVNRIAGTSRSGSI
jgi:hypothetical protein